MTWSFSGGEEVVPQRLQDEGIDAASAGYLMGLALEC